MTAVYPGGAPNTYVPEATEKFRIEYSRNPRAFQVMDYCQIIPVDKSVGYWLKISAEECGRILDADLASHAWADGAPSPEFNDGTEGFEFLGYQARRRAYGYNLGDIAAKEATWDVHAQMGRTKAMQCMTARTVKVAALAQTSGNYDTGHYSAVASISGVSGRWDQSTTARADIKRSINYAVNVILKASMGVVNASELVLVMSPRCAMQISESQELIDHIKGSPEAYAQVRGELPNSNLPFGLPEKLYGVKCVVDQAVKVTSKKGATLARDYVLDATLPFICTRKDGVVGTPQNGDAAKTNFSSFSLFMKEEMTVEQKSDGDGWHRRTIGRVTDHFAEAFTATATAFLFTSAVQS